MKNKILKNSAAYLSLMGLFTSCGSFERFLASTDEPINNRSAHQVYGELQESGVGFNARALMVGEDLVNQDMVGGVTWGAEK